MDRLLLSSNKNNKYISKELTSNRFVIDCEKLRDNFIVKLEDNIRANILIINIKDLDISFDLGRYASLSISFLAKGEIKNLKIHANLDKYAEMEGYFADFIEKDNKTTVEIDLNGEEAATYWHLASLATLKDKKAFDVSVYHNYKNTYCKLDNYGVCLNESNLTFEGICKINNGCSGSKAHQNAKIMVFDKACKGIAKPILKIDENDIEASHAAVVGKINDEHLFYLTSRGLSESEAKELITLGYLKPILNGFDDEDVKEEIERLIEGRM